MSFIHLFRSLSLNPKNSKAHFLLAELLERQKDYKGSAAHYTAYLNLETNPPFKKFIEKKIEKLVIRSGNK